MIGVRVAQGCVLTLVAVGIFGLGPAHPLRAMATTGYATPTPGPGDRDEGSEPERLIVDRDSNGLPYVAGELLVTYHPGALGGQIAAANDAVDAETEDRFPQIDARALELPRIKQRAARSRREVELEAARRELEAHPAVKSADYNYVDETEAMPNDPLFGQQWGLPRIRAPQAWDVTRGDQTLIAVLDSGIQSAPSGTTFTVTHPDIGSKIVAGADFVNGTQVPTDNNGHGTHVTGIATALTDNNTGVAGASPQGRAVAGKVCEDTGGGLGGPAACPLSAQVNGLIQTANRGDVDVINMSLGGLGCPPAQRDAIDFAAGRGIAIVAAAGNEDDDTPRCPASYPNVIAVSATNILNGKSSFSNFGDWIDIAAPGGHGGAPPDQRILSTYPVSTYAALNGTSMASPFVAGVAGLLAAQGANASQIRKRLLFNATDLGAPGKDAVFGHGLLNARAAVDNVACNNAERGVQTAQGPADAAGQAAAEADRTAEGAKRRARKAKRKARKAKRRAKKQGTEGAARKARRATRRAKKAKRASTRAEEQANSASEAFEQANAALNLVLVIRSAVC